MALPRLFLKGEGFFRGLWIWGDFVGRMLPVDLEAQINILYISKRPHPRPLSRPIVGRCPERGDSIRAL
jgi:hypothetical protein